MKWAGRPAYVSRAMTPPQPNSISSGCAPKARSGVGLEGELGVGFIGVFNRVSGEKRDFGSLFLPQVLLFAFAFQLSEQIPTRDLAEPAIVLAPIPDFGTDS